MGAGLIVLLVSLTCLFCGFGCEFLDIFVPSLYLLKYSSPFVLYCFICIKVWSLCSGAADFLGVVRVEKEQNGTQILQPVWTLLWIRLPVWALEGWGSPSLNLKLSHWGRGTPWQWFTSKITFESYFNQIQHSASLSSPIQLNHWTQSGFVPAETETSAWSTGRSAEPRRRYLKYTTMSSWSHGCACWWWASAAGSLYWLSIAGHIPLHVLPCVPPRFPGVITSSLSLTHTHTLVKGKKSIHAYIKNKMCVKHAWHCEWTRSYSGEINDLKIFFSYWNLLADGSAPPAAETALLHWAISKS